MVKQPLLSVIVTSYTDERLKDTFELLDSMKIQTYSQIEIILVIERSKELLNKIKFYIQQQAIPNTKVLFNYGEPGLSAARNVGIKECRGDIIAFVDDDVVLYKDWAEEMVKAYQNDAIIGVTGPAFPLWEDESMSWFPEEFYWIISCTAWVTGDYAREVRNAWGMNMSFKREAFEKCGLFFNEFGFHKGPMAEDNEFSLRVKEKTGKSIYYYPNIKLWHRVHKYRLSQKFIKERAAWIGYSRYMMKQVLPKNKSGTSDLFSQEHQLLKRIIFRLFPSILKKFLTQPVIAWRITRITATALTFVVIGYYSYITPAFLKRKKDVKFN